MKTSLLRARPHLWYQLYWVLYLIWFFWLDLTVTDPKYIIHSPLDEEQVGGQAVLGRQT